MRGRKRIGRKRPEVKPTDFELREAEKNTKDGFSGLPEFPRRKGYLYPATVPGGKVGHTSRTNRGSKGKRKPQGQQRRRR